MHCLLKTHSQYIQTKQKKKKNPNEVIKFKSAPGVKNVMYSYLGVLCFNFSSEKLYFPNAEN